MLPPHRQDLLGGNSDVERNMTDVVSHKLKGLLESTGDHQTLCFDLKNKTQIVFLHTAAEEVRTA